MSFNPRAKLLENPVRTKKFRDFVDDPDNQETIHGVYIEFAGTNPTQEELKGVNRFLKNFIGFADPPQKHSIPPDKSRGIHEQFDEPVKPRKEK
jgi:hypothetical protein